MKKKIISVVLVMTMVFALLAVSASARDTAITSVSLTGIPAQLYYGDNIANIIAGIQIPDAANYEVCKVMVINTSVASPTPQTSGTIGATGTWVLEIDLKAKEDSVFKFKNEAGSYVFDGTVTSNGEVTECSTVAYSKMEGDRLINITNVEDKAGVISVGFMYNIENETHRPEPGPTPTPDFDFDFSGLLAKILELIGWKKITDNIKTVSILTIIFKIIEAIVAKLVHPKN